MIKNIKKTMKTLVFSLGLVALMLTVNNLNAQDGGGIFGLGSTSESAGSYQEESLLRAGGGSRTYVNINGNGSDPTGITINGIGQSEAPLGSGIAILIGAGLGYVTLKKKEDEQ